MLINNMELIPGKRVSEHFGLVQGSYLGSRQTRGS